MTDMSWAVEPGETMPAITIDEANAEIRAMVADRTEEDEDA